MKRDHNTKKKLRRAEPTFVGFGKVSSLQKYAGHLPFAYD
jgi:hypothetical protein